MTLAKNLLEKVSSESSKQPSSPDKALAAVILKEIEIRKKLLKTKYHPRKKVGKGS